MLSRSMMNGVFAINKPKGPSSNDVLTRIKEYFSDHDLFQAQIQQQQDKRYNPHKKGKHVKKRHKFVKIGHGGTLDPMAAGVLVIGLGNGTKQLGDYLGKCKKTYRATALFGSSTTTYDAEGSIVRRAGTKHLSNEKVAQVLDQFRGKISQTPPVYSALKMNGKPLYEYARTGEALPKEIQPRECYVDQFDVLGELSWDHEYSHPKNEATEEEKQYAAILNKLGSETPIEAANEQVDAKDPILDIEFTVSSGTYIRSLIHDMGLALGTTAHMVKLTRTAQSDWKLDENVFEVDDFLNRPDDGWEPELRHYLEHGPGTSLKDLRTQKSDGADESTDTPVADDQTSKTTA